MQRHTITFDTLILSTATHKMELIIPRYLHVIQSKKLQNIDSDTYRRGGLRRGGDLPRGGNISLPPPYMSRLKYQGNWHYRLRQCAFHSNILQWTNSVEINFSSFTQKI